MVDIHDKILDAVVGEIESLSLCDVEKRRIPLKQQDRQNKTVVTVSMAGEPEDPKIISFQYYEVVYPVQVVVQISSLGRNNITSEGLTAYDYRRKIWEHFAPLTELPGVSTVFNIVLKPGATLDTGKVSTEHADWSEIKLLISNYEQRAAS